jgi:hypothetical protein
MKIDYVVLADCAQAVAGKLFILGGGWKIFRATIFPSPIQLALAISVSFNSTESAMKFPLAVRILDDAGTPIAPEVGGQIETGVPSADLPRGVNQSVPFAVNLNLSLPHPGRYKIMVTVGSAKVDTAFDAVVIGKAAQTIMFQQLKPERGN